jgi:hypothetical protein
LPSSSEIINLLNKKNMKSLFVAVCCLCLLAGCANPNQAVQPAEELLPYELPLEACKKVPDSPYLVRYTLTNKVGIIKKGRETYVIMVDNNMRGMCNLPISLQEEGLKIRFSANATLDTDPTIGTMPVLEFTSIAIIK